MHDDDIFEAHRTRLRAIAFRMLGGPQDADDAVQEAWLRYSRSDTSAVDNLAGWLTTVVARVCLDLLRSRAARRDEPVGDLDPELPAGDKDPEHEALLAEEVSLALLVVLDRLAPAERIAFVLHDLFAVPFDEIAPIVDRTPETTKKLASRARQKVRGVPAATQVDLAWHRKVVEAFLAAARGRDIAGLLAVLAPDVIRRADPAALPAGVPLEVSGARTVGEETLVRGGGARFADVVLVNGGVGAVIAPRGRLKLVLAFTVRGDAIVAYDVIADPTRVRELELAVLDDGLLGSEAID